MNLTSFTNDRGWTYHYDNGSLIGVDYSIKHFCFKHTDDKWYRQDGSNLIVSGNDKHYWDDDGDLFRIEYQNGYVEDFS